MTREEAIKKLESTVGAYLLSGNADETTCGEWREILNTLKEEKKQENKGKKKRWKPKKWGDEYWTITTSGVTHVSLWADSDFDESAYKMGNCYKTEEECKFAAECELTEQELKDYADEHNEHEIVVGEYSPCFNLYYDLSLDEIKVEGYHSIRHKDVYFTSAEIARNAIKEIGEERLKKYYFKVVEE